LKEQFSIAASGAILALIDRAGERAGLSRGQAFEDFLTFVRCCLAGQTMEEEYLATVAKGYGSGEQGKRGIDYVTKAFAELVMAMETDGGDVLGDIFTGGITYGEKGQFFTPDTICELMVGLTIQDDESRERKSVNDPTCGSGRFLLAVGKKHPHWELVGQDVDHRCAQMTAINLGLHGLRGWAVWQNTLTLECHRVYRIGFNLSGGVIREVPADKSPFHYITVGTTTSSVTNSEQADEQPTGGTDAPDDPQPPSSDPPQLELF